MSTNINITVGDNALLDAAKQQQAANRQAQLNREASTRLEAQATAARTAALATQGRDANGNLIAGAPFTQPQIDRRPAANRTGSDAWSLYFRETPTFFNAVIPSDLSFLARWSALDFMYKNRRLVSTQPLALRSFPLDQGTINPFEYLIGVAPGGTNAISAQPVPSPGPPAPGGFEVINQIPSFELFPGTVLPTVVKNSVPFRPSNFSATLECDVKTVDLFASFSLRIIFYGGDGSTALFADYSVRIGRSGLRPSFTYRVLTDKGIQYDIVNEFLVEVVPLNTWTRIAFVIDRGSSRLFVNGELKDQVSNPVESDLQTIGLATFNLSCLETQVNGLLVTPRSLYSANYTPQTLKF